MNRYFRSVSLIASLLAVCCFMSSCTDKNNSESSSSSQSQTSAETSQPAETSAEESSAEATETEPAETTPPHVSPTENISVSMGCEKSDINEIMDYESNKNFKIKLSDFAQSGDKIESFVFVFYSEDGKSDMGDYTGGCGISVSGDCPSATDDGWYQSEDFTCSTQGSYAEIKWNVPSDIQDYIEISDDGFIQIGYWWSNVKKLKLSSVICNYTRNAVIPVDGNASADIGKQLYYGSQDSRTLNIPLNSLISDGDIPQTFTFNISASGSLQKFSGAFGISVTDGCPSQTDDNWYQSKNAAVITDDSSVSVTWIVPDEIKDYIDTDGDVMLGYWWSAVDNITLDSVSVKYSNNGSSASNEPAQTIAENNFSSSEKNVSEMSSAEIVADMRVGWNLGNTLDTYNVSGASNAETAWGNPVTTKAMIDTVKAAGFNAVRIPVSWTDHLDSNYNIDKQWLDRVQEIVDYCIDNDLYTIINVHHDDYTWLNPTYADQQKVTEEYTAIWKQICEKFKDYDEHLLFEGLNEPRVIDGENEWTCGTAEERDVINQLLQTFVDTVRASGGKNSSRHLIVTTHTASIDETAVNDLKIPDDDRIIVSIHYYYPWDFAGEESDVSQWGSDDEKKALDKGFDLLYNKFVKNGIPVIIGEFGTVNKNNTDVRAEYMEYYLKSAHQRNITCFVWDDGSKFKLLNRPSSEWYYPQIINGIMDGIK